MSKKITKRGAKVKMFSTKTVVSQLLKTRAIVTYEEAERAIKGAFPKSKFNRKAWAWWKWAYKTGLLEGRKG